MCQHGDTVETIIGGKPVAVDRCIVQLVIAINSGGAQTVASCCGHGHRPGRISLRDGRELFVLPSYEAGQELDATFPLDIHGHRRPNQSSEGK